MRSSKGLIRATASETMVRPVWGGREWLEVPVATRTLEFTSDDDIEARLRDYIDRRKEEDGFKAVIRKDSGDAITLIFVAGDCRSEVVLLFE